MQTIKLHHSLVLKSSEIKNILEILHNVMHDKKYAYIIVLASEFFALVVFCLFCKISLTT